MALQLLKFPNHSIISRRFSRAASSFFFLVSQPSFHHKLPARWVGVPIHRSFTAVRLEKVQPAKKKRRLDEVCLERYEQYSRTFIQSWILQGKVFVDGKIFNKAGTPVSDKSVV